MKKLYLFFILTFFFSTSVFSQSVILKCRGMDYYANNELLLKNDVERDYEFNLENLTIESKYAIFYSQTDVKKNETWKAPIGEPQIENDYTLLNITYIGEGYIVGEQIRRGDNAKNIYEFDLINNLLKIILEDSEANEYRIGYNCIDKTQVLKDIAINLEKENENYVQDESIVVPASSGTGFFVSTNGHMVTNNHVIESCDVVKAHYKGKDLDADVLFTDKTNDLAIIKANINPNKVFSVSDEDISLLENVIVAGYPLGKKISTSIKTSKGSVTSLAGVGNNFSNFQIDAALNSGNSGGPIMDQKGNVVGVAVEMFGKDIGVESFNFGVKSSTLKTFASSNEFKFQDPSTEELSNKELGQLITEATIYLECWMSVAKIKQIIEEGEQQKAFFSEYK